MPVPEEFVKKRTEVTISRAALKDITCKGCGAPMDAKNIRGGYATCEYCGSVATLDVQGSSSSP
jgi:hypothetical protein